MRLGVDEALYLGRIATGAVLATGAIWVAFGPELGRAVDWLLTWREGRQPTADGVPPTPPAVD